MTFERSNKTQTVRITPDIHYIAKEAAWSARVSLQKYIEDLIMKAEEKKK
jgi:predicted HicB family RNase H-like nuclease